MSRACRRRDGGRVAALLATIALLGSGCVAPGPEPSRPSGPPIASDLPPTQRSASGSGTPGSGAPESNPSSGGATPLPDPPAGDRPTSAFTIVCDDWPGDPSADAIGCADAVQLALAAIDGDQAAVVRRLDVGFGDPCDPGATCAASPTVRWVTARSAAFETLRIRVARTADGVLAVWPPVDGRPQPPPPFAAPSPAAADVGRDAPARLRDRPALPACGSETIATPDAFDTAARRCFLGGVLGWVGVELVSTDTSTGGEAVLTVDRFAGRGGIERYVRSANGWAAATCAITPIATSAVFVLVRPCEPIGLGP